jgi:hypothetical protein
VVVPGEAEPALKVLWAVVPDALFAAPPLAPSAEPPPVTRPPAAKAPVENIARSGFLLGHRISPPE